MAMYENLMGLNMPQIEEIKPQSPTLPSQALETSYTNASIVQSSSRERRKRS